MVFRIAWSSPHFFDFICFQVDQLYFLSVFTLEMVFGDTVAILDHTENGVLISTCPSSLFELKLTGFICIMIGYHSLTLRFNISITNQKVSYKDDRVFKSVRFFMLFKFNQEFLWVLRLDRFSCKFDGCLKCFLDGVTLTLTVDGHDRRVMTNLFAESPISRSHNFESLS